MNYFKEINAYLKKEEPAYIRYLYNGAWYFTFIKILLIISDYMSAFIGKRPFIHQAIEYENAAPISSIISLFAFHAWKVALPILGCYVLKFWVEREKILKNRDKSA